MTTPDLTTRPPIDVEAHRAHIEAKRARNRYFEQLNRKVIEAASRPTKVAPMKRTRTATSTEPRVRAVTIVDCPECGHPTRATGISAARAPGTRQRRGGMCVNCFIKTRPSSDTRGTGTKVTDAEVEAWVAAYQRGQRITSIARDAARPPITVRAHLVRVGVHEVAS